MRTSELLEILRTCDGLPDEIVSRLPTFEHWLRLPYPVVRNDSPGVEVFCPSCNDRPQASVRAYYDKYARYPLVTAWLRRYVILKSDWQTSFLFWFGVCRSCDRALIAY